MNYKIEKALKKSMMPFIIMIVVWITLTILLIAPITVSLVESRNSNEFFEVLFSTIGDIGENVGKLLRSDYIATFGKAEGYLAIAMLLLFVVGLVKSMPKNEYTDIEHGSSDWASGEQYSVLSKKNGILLAEKHYLPVDKRGNVNVLVVGRIRFSENLHHMLFQMLINF